MSGNHLDPVAIHSRLTHPVVDSDGHWLEFGPTILEYMNKVGGAKAAEGLKSREEVVTSILMLSAEQRHDERRTLPAWWAFPTKNTLDRATALMPKLLYERMGELGLDFTVLYPTTGLALPFIGNDESRRAACRAFNMYIADTFRDYSDKMTPVAIIPMNTPDEAIAELDYVANTLKLKVVVMASLIRRPIASYVRKGETNRLASWYDVLGIDSDYDYDPVWAKCAELKIAPTFHTASRGLGLRTSDRNHSAGLMGRRARHRQRLLLRPGMGQVRRIEDRAHLPHRLARYRTAHVAEQFHLQPYRPLRGRGRGGMQGDFHGRRDTALSDAQVRLSRRRRRMGLPALRRPDWPLEETQLQGARRGQSRQPRQEAAAPALREIRGQLGGRQARRMAVGAGGRESGSGMGREGPRGN